MKQFAQQEDRLVHMQREAMERRDRERADAFAALRQAHEERKTAIIQSLARRAREEEEVELRKSLEWEMNSHSGSVTTVEHNLEAMKGRMEDLEARIAEAQTQQTEVVERIKMMEEENHRKRKLAIASQEAMLRDARRRLADEAKEIERRKDNVLAESDSINTAIKSLQGELERTVTQLEVDYHIQKQTAGANLEDVERKRRRLVSHVDQQQSLIREAQEQYISTTTQAMQLELAIGGEIEQFEQKQKNEMEANFSYAQGKAMEMAMQLSNVANMFRTELDELMAQLELARATTDRVANRLLIERSHLVQEIELSMTTAAEEERAIINTRAAERVRACEIQFMDQRQECDESMLEKRIRHKRLLEELRMEYGDNESELEEQKEILQDEEGELDEIIQRLSERECPACEQQKAVLYALQERQRLLSQKVLSMHRRSGKSDEMLDMVFAERVSVSRPVTSSGIPKVLIKRPSTRSPALNPRTFRF
jgi:hypothetical protein